MRSSRPLHLLVAAGVLVSIVAPVTRDPAYATVDPSAGLIDREPLTAPGELGAAELDRLQFGDPLESTVLMGRPEANVQGSAQLSHPLDVPPGRAGVQPDLALTYDSSAGSSWLGQGWNLSLGEISLDTRFGVPRYSSTLETETYVLDGEQLHPTAVRTDFAARVADRDDFTRRVEDEFERIVRHGDSPKNYHWQVTDKDGTDRWYGGSPAGFDPTSVLTDSDDNIFKWGLTYVEDISANVMRANYAKPTPSIGANGATGISLYLSTITYTGSVAAPPAKDDPPYEVRFIRRGDRKDVQVDASGGGLEVTKDLLERVEVWYGVPNPAGVRSHNQLVRAYELDYNLDGPFAKTLLTAVHQYGRSDVPMPFDSPDFEPFATHEFEYFDEVTDGNGNYTGFSGPVAWDTGVDDIFREGDLPTVGSSVLGSATTIGGDGGAYIGFNPVVPSKQGSFGGSFMLEGSQSDSTVEFFDLNGDGLPDKVFKSSSGVTYRLNTSKPSDLITDVVTFGERKPLTGIDSLSKEVDFGINLSLEAHVGVSVQLATGMNFAFGDRWFSDVNGDGLPDFIKDGQVYFNELDGADNPTFVQSADQTAIPLDSFSSAYANAGADIEGVGDLSTRQREMAPLIDTVRRWIAPYEGTVTIDGAATLDPPGTDPYVGDGVVVAIQHSTNQIWTQPLLSVGASATHNLTRNVSAGQAIYFRVNAIDDGARDQVSWNPIVTYTNIGAARTDANGLPEATYVAADDFTLAGIGEARTDLTLAGSATLDATIVQSGYLSDDVRVVLRHGNWVTGEVTENSVTFDGSLHEDGGLDFEAPVAPITQLLNTTIEPNAARLADPDNGIDAATDWVSLSLESDTPIDPNSIGIAARLHYTAFDADQGLDLDPATYPDVPLLPTTDLYPNASPGVGPLVAPPSAWTPSETGEVTIDASIGGGTGSGGFAVLSVKTPAGLVAKQEFSISGDPLEGTSTLTLEVTEGVPYWIEITVQDGSLGQRLARSSVEVSRENGSIPITIDEAEHVRRWAGPQSYFQLGHHGWGTAGYNAGPGPIDPNSLPPLDEGAFIVNTSAVSSTPTVDGLSSIGPDPAFAYAPLGIEAADGSTVIPAWRLDRASVSATAGELSSSRLGLDSIVGTTTAASTSGRPALQRLGVGGPGISFSAGLVVGITGGVSPSWGTRDLIDVNGDGIADVVTDPGTTYTLPRGGTDTVSDSASLSGEQATAFDTQFAVGGGIGGSPVSFSFSSTGDGPTSQDTSTSSGATGQPGAPATSNSGHAAEKTRGFNIGLGFEVMARWTNPVDDDISDISSDNSDLPGVEPLRERQLVDMNGDGLPDAVRVSNSKIEVFLNTGYGFSDTPILWGGGALESTKTLSGTLSPGLGFNVNAYEFGGGIAYTEAVSYSRFAWVDLDGDGVLDRLRKDGEQEGHIGVSWGNARDTATEVVYGEPFVGEVDLNEPDGNSDGAVMTGPQISQSRTSGLAGGVDFTISIGPLCLVACYLIVNPGIHVSGDVSRTQIQMIDVNGDGYPDSVRSRDDGVLEVRLNLRGRTNLLQKVENPIGGSIEMNYERTGNTAAQPISQWLMTEVNVNDGRPGDGPDVQSSTFEYTGNVYDRLERAHLGHSRIVERQHASAGGPVLRTIERKYRNDTIFHTGQLTLEQIRMADGGRLFYQREATWSLVGVGGSLVPGGFPGANTPQRTALLEKALSPRLVGETQSWFDADGDSQTKHSAYTYDALGNVLTIRDGNEHEVAADDTFTKVTYSNCQADLPDGSLNSWVSVPATVTVYAGLDDSGAVMRERDGSRDLCLNAVPILIIETIDDTTTAVTEMTFDEYGSYDSVTHPENGPSPTGAATNRYRVDYVYDADRFTDLATVTDSHGIVASASYDPFTGRLASRTDPNGNITTYNYDNNNRLSEIVAPKERLSYAAGGPATVEFEYVPAAGTAHAYAVASHIAPTGSDQIRTAAFVDGIGRVTQRKQDGSVFVAAGEPAADVMIVEGAVEFDALGREVKEWYPITEELMNGGVERIGDYNFSTSAVSPTERDYDTLDRLTVTTLPDGSTTGTRYGIEEIGGGLSLFAPVAFDPFGKEIQTFRDVRGLVHAIVESPLNLDSLGDSYIESVSTNGDLTTSYIYDALGRLTEVKDPENAVTEHSYDMLDRMTSITTPDAGLLEREWSPAGSMIAEIDAVQRAAAEKVTWSYDMDRLVSIDYPGTDLDVEYTYDSSAVPAAEALGVVAPPATGASNQMGQVASVRDGAMRRVFEYDEDGKTRAEHTTMFTNSYDPLEPEATTHRTMWEFDSFGRVLAIDFHDGETLEYSFDSGGLIESAVGTVPMPAIGPEPTGTSTSGEKRLMEFGPYEYIESQQYDEFLRPAYRRTGGNTETVFEYDDDRLWYMGQQTTAASGREVQDLSYERDVVGNVILESNDLPTPSSSEPEGPATHSWTYDPYYRVTQSTGAYVGPKDKDDRAFAYTADYAPNGRLVNKTQTAVTGASDVEALLDEAATTTASAGVPADSTTAKRGNGGNSQGGKSKGGNSQGGPTTDGDCDQPTNGGGGDTGQDTQITYALDDLEYSADNPHRLIRSASRDYSYDANGQMTGWVEDCTSNSSEKVRVITWDATRRMASISDGDHSSTTYRYSAEGTRAIERGPGGEYSFVNDVWTGINGGTAWKHIFVGSERIAMRRWSEPKPTIVCLQPDDPTVDSDGNPIPDPCEGRTICDAADGTLIACPPEPTIYFVHTDLLGSTRSVTDESGVLFEHLEYLPMGRPWVRNGSTSARVPYRYAGAWHDATNELVSFGARWFEPREQHFYGPDPVLIDEPTSVIDTPSLLSAYSYAANNPATLVDADGREPTFSPRDKALVAGVDDKPSALSNRSKRLNSITTVLAFDFKNGELQRFRIFGKAVVDNRTDDSNQGQPANGGPKQPTPADTDSTTDDSTSDSSSKPGAPSLDDTSLSRSSSSSSLTESANPSSSSEDDASATTGDDLSPAAGTGGGSERSSTKLSSADLGEMSDVDISGP